MKKLLICELNTTLHTIVDRFLLRYSCFFIHTIEVGSDLTYLRLISTVKGSIVGHNMLGYSH